MRAINSSDSASDFKILVRYVPHTINYDDALPETEFARIERTVSFETSLSAFISLDVWSWHFMPSLRERMDRITRERIGPLATACRAAGIMVVHAPSPPVAAKYPDHRYWPPSEWKRGPQYTPTQDEAGWPTREMRLRSGPFRPYSLRSDPDAPRLTEERLYERYAIHTATGPEHGDFVVATREELHALLSSHRKFHLFYAGFVTNGCMLERDYGIRHMSYMGYNAVLLRDCTTGLEAADTLADFEQTRASIHNLEYWHATSTSDRLLAAL